ncbi:hypothetical protein BDF20DRAFT_913709 [Mycotypha africana]|uniref:uncharacterized protein n=1 Tax=Mycotypha africana TaxID=64632 RepID=UPI0023004C00|nr:uncharacterized protein BDF20DRAFT_913709 [Mycotypha africana]KAI8977380.1 hypothetical protein BDF20DRAFT_913709 [Mycotypha africana]
MVLQGTRVKDIFRVVGFILIIQLIIIPITRTWSWREDECKLFELATQFKKNQTDFYAWLDVKPTATAVDIGKAYRKLTLHMHPTAHEDRPSPEYEITKQIGYILRTPKLRSLYDTILQNDGKTPFFKGWYYLWTRHKLSCLAAGIIITGIVLDYLRQLDAYFKEKIVIDEFMKNAKLMAQRLDDNNSESNEKSRQGRQRKQRKNTSTPLTHKSFIDLGDRVLACEITKDKEIFILNEKNERLPFTVSNVLKKPSICHVRELFNKQQMI